VVRAALLAAATKVAAEIAAADMEALAAERAATVMGAVDAVAVIECVDRAATVV
ncbi:hypothetical protein L9F63_028199, partial [Diploptera punctata]